MAISQDKTLTGDISPVRKIGRGTRSIRGTAIVHGGPISFESSLERDFLEITDFDRSVTKVCEQPCRIDYTDRAGRGRSYVPDFLTVHRSPEEGPTRTYLYEIKYRDDLFKKWPSLKPKFLAARRYARERSWEFVIMTEVEIRGQFLSNAKILNQYRTVKANGGIEEKLIATLATMGETTIRALLDASWNCQQRKTSAMAHVLRLIALDRIHVDLSAPVNLKSTIWTTVGEGFQCDPHSFRQNPV